MNSIKPLYTYLDELDFESKTAQHAKYFGLDIMVYRQFVFGFLQKLYERIVDESAQPESKPLTLDELLRMKGEPVWVSDIDPFSQDKCSCWAIVGDAEEAGIELYDKFCDKNYIDFGASELYGKTWLAYRAKPKEVEHE